jgi:hypothetical protein
MPPEAVPPDEECVIRLPNRDWAAVGAAELEALGFRTRVADDPDPDGQWPVVVWGTPAQIAALRGEIPGAARDEPPAPGPHLVCPAFDWQPFVNDAVEGAGA